MSQTFVVNGWRIYGHPLFLAQVEELIFEVERCKASDPTNYKSKDCSKHLAAITKLITESVPADPASPRFRLGKTLGNLATHWRRAKFFGQYRLFFRYRSEGKLIVFGWVNDKNSERAHGSKTDACEMFRKMLECGNPPDDFEDLLTEARGITG